MSEQYVDYAVRKVCGLLGLCLALGLYSLCFLHFYAFVKVISPLLKRRLGDKFGILWIAVGLIILYNILFNHFWAMIIKPGSPKDLKMIEKMREQ